eukprot:CAMPEP_0114230742 /NCGR_PEP_ID=MMETSP0058-20121206/3639_1 /TAXON_ID=36894 /ORGANISM="Pyramimonas parkeae, CCMP726" /LENGTH=300 /DNA_ID=CAMNT_0001341977 /DNA_START=211 /DNA_END=1113 /DNA_ORIENTATION=-
MLLDRRSLRRPRTQACAEHVQIWLRKEPRMKLRNLRPMCLQASHPTHGIDATKKFEGVQVVLFGWLGAQPKYLDKYVELWESRGAVAIPYIPPLTATLIPAQADRSVREFAQLVEKRRAQHPPPRKVVYHVFSNGGFLFLSSLIRATSKGLVPADAFGTPDGIIIDSAPGVITSDMAARGFGAAAMKTGSDGFEERQPLLVDVARGLFGSYLNLPSIKTRMEEIRIVWADLAPLCPQLLLYSEEDVLIPPADIENHMTAQISRGVNVMSRKWIDSLHVEHFRKYPDEYVDEVASFVDNLH